MDLLTAVLKRLRPALAGRVATVFAVTLLVGPVASASVWTTGLAASSSSATRSRVLAAPTGVDAECAALGLKVVLSWNAVANAASYGVYMSSTGLNGTYNLVTTVATNSYSSGVLGLGTYYFKVTATIGANWTSGLSAASQARVITLVLCS